MSSLIVRASPTLQAPAIAVRKLHIHGERIRQLEAFKHLRSRLRQLHDSVKGDVSDYVTPIWAETNQELESKILSNVPFGFLRDGTIAWMMFLHSPRSELLVCERDYLEEHHSKETLKAWLREDPVGNPKLVSARYLTSHNLIHHLYHLSQYISQTGQGFREGAHVVEWGGGYGSMARLIARMRSGGRYTLVDTPIVSCLQWLYLGSIFGSDSIYFSGFDDPSKRKDCAFHIVPLTALSREEVKGEIFISTWALSESSAYAQDFVVESGWFGASRLLLAFDKSSSSVPHSSRLGELAARSGAGLADVPCLPGHSYAFRS